jgi:N utilization substance protein B
MAGVRRQARVLAMQALCQWDVQRDESEDALRGLLSCPEPLANKQDPHPPLPVAQGEALNASESSSQAADYAFRLVWAYWSNREGVDGRIAAAARNWSLERISPVERNVLRVAVVELEGAWVPPKVAVNEAIEIGNEYGGADSGRFINGILDEVLRKLRADRPVDA